jgi:hypothetical protein
MLNEKFKDILEQISDYDEINTVESKLLSDKDFIIALFYKFGKREDFFPDMILYYASEEIKKDSEFLIPTFIKFLRLTYSDKYLYSNHEEALYTFFSSYIKQILIDENVTLKLFKDYSEIGILYDKNFLKDVQNNHYFDGEDSYNYENLRDFLFRITIEATNFKNHLSLIKISDFVGWETIKYLPDHFKTNEELLCHLLKKNIKVKNYISDDIIKNSPIISSLLSQKEISKKKRISKKELINTLITDPEKFTQETAGKKINISLKGLENIPDNVAIALGKHFGDVTFNDLIELNDIAASNLINLNGKIYFEKLESISDTTAEILSKHKKKIYFDNLSSLSDSAALSFINNKTQITLKAEKFESLSVNVAKLFVINTPYKNSSLFGDIIEVLRFYSLKNITKEIAFELSKFKGELSFRSLEDISSESANELAKHKGPIIYLGGIKTINDDVASILSNYNGEILNLYSLISISDLAAAELSKYKGELHLGGLITISSVSAKKLAKHKGKKLSLVGLKNISEEVAIELSKHNGSLNLNGLTSLSEEVAIALSNHVGNLQLNNIISITENAAEAFSKSNSNSIEFHRLKDISESIKAKLKTNSKIFLS